MKRLYMLYHWSLTLVFGPFVVKGIESVFNFKPSIIGDLGVYPVTFVFSILFSLPTLVVYTAWFFFIEKHHKNVWFVKSTLTMIAVAGIIFTFKYTKLNIENTAIWGYCICAIAFGYLERLKSDKAVIEQSPDNDQISST